MATRGIYLTRNNVRSLYPCAEVDMAAMIAAHVIGEIGISLNGVYATGYEGRFQTITDPTWITEGITDPRSDRQIVYFDHDNINDCYERVTLSSEPDDFYIDGLDDPPAPRHANATYYTGSRFRDGYRLTYALNQTYTPADYYYNNSCCCICKTDTGYYFGMAFNNVYSPASGYDYYQFEAWYLWRNNFAGLDETFNTYPQYGLQTPPIGTIGFNRTYWISPSISGDNPLTPTNVITEFVIGEYNDKTYVGMCFHEITSDGTPTGRLHLWMFPIAFWGEVVPYEEPSPIPDPGDFGPESEPDAGGDGTYTDTNAEPVIPSPADYLSSLSSYGVHLYRISDTDYGALMSAIWGSGADFTALWSRWINYKFNPLQGIIANHFIPDELMPPVGATPENMQVAGITLTKTVAHPIEQCTRVTIGSLSVPEFFGNALDYSPYTVMRLYLPFCGWIDIDPDRVVGGGLLVVYTVDASTGDVCAYVKCYDRTGDSTYMYTATGNCAFTLPVTGNDQGTGAILNSLAGAAMGLVSGNIVGAAASAAGALSAQHHMQITGSVSGSVGLISDLTCRLQIIRPVQSTPKYGQQLRGRPSDIGCQIGDLIGTGWTSFDAVHADIEGATVEECAEIERLLRQGVIL